ncbi:hypothetical protein [Bacillus sp. USDA818B3_A]|uniref:hypothetical protein n=1 Tax=Bacillus sp. USDA818B3_A TaxID=2698834 RepID=UPI001370BD9E|nr:hypothetical protein [Bacillus sp. USDA818B3_A]
MGLEKFSAALDLLVGFHVNLYVGEEIFKGKLIGVETDHVVLETENKYIFYYNIDKIQAITKNTKQFQPEGATVEFQRTQSLMELLHSFHYSWVTILSINKQRFYGVLSEIDEDFVTLINGEERILIKVTHISNILKGFIKEKPKKKEQQKSDSKNETKNQNNDSKDNDKDNDSDNGKEKNKDKASDNDKDKNKDKNIAKENDKEKNKNKEKDKEKVRDKNKEKENVKCKDTDDIPCQEPKEYTAETYTGEKTIKFQSNCDTCDKEQDLGIIEVSEKSTPMIWSQPIKVESSKQESKEVDLSKDKKLKNETESPQMTKKEIKQTINEMDHKKMEESESPQMSKKETKRTVNETSQKEKKSEESKTNEVKSNKESKTNEVKSNKESKSSKESKTNKDTKQTTTNPTSKKEKKQEKPQENTTTSNIVLTKATVTKNKETATNEKFDNDTQKVWKQKDKETRTARFTGEPVPRNQERNFPFAGWPRSNKRTFRF